MVESIRVLVVDESPGLTQGLILALPRRGPVFVLGPVPDAPEALAAMEEGLADMVLVDLDRSDGRGAEVVGAIRDGGGRIRVLAASGHADGRDGPEVIAMALAAGACGVLPSERDRSLIDVFRRAFAGELVLPAADLPRLVDRLVASNGSHGLTSLTTRERQILCSLADGSSTVEIASTLSISPLTVQSHVKSILAKLGVHSKVEAVRLAWRHGLGSSSRSA
ncbi:MAG TPA: response regulator transcription factor [Actinomycetota bacterium]